MVVAPLRHRSSSLKRRRTFRERKRGQQGFAGLDRRHQSGGRAEGHQGRRAEGRDRRLRRHLYAQDGQSRGDVRRGAGLSRRATASSPTSSPRFRASTSRSACRRRRTEIEQIQWWRNYFKNAPSHPTKAVNGGPLLDNVLSGKDVNIEKIPTPVWHELDGGPFIGTACLVVMKDPDSGWVNYGTYRVQSHEPKTCERDDVARQARPDHHAQVSRARADVPGRGDRRHASGDGDARRHRNSLRQERA